MKVLITGIEGFAGSHLADLLLEDRYKLHGIKYPGSSYQNIAHIQDKIEVIELDINEHEKVAGYLKRIEPEAIVHLAALSKVGHSWKSRLPTYQTNIIATANLLEIAGSLQPPPRVLVISSAEVYGTLSDAKMPIKEDYPVNPVNPYAVSKAAVELITKQLLKERPELNWAIIRPFNHTGPRQQEGFVCSDFARQIALIEAGILEPEIRVGNLQSKRDFCDVRDTVKAYKMLINSSKHGIFHICSGRAIEISYILEQLLSECKRDIRVIIDELKLRPVDTPVIVGDNTKIKEETGWHPQYPLEQTLKDLLNYWRREVTKRGNK